MARAPATTLASGSNNGVHTIRVTDGLRLTLPAIITFASYIILAILLLIPFDMYAWDEEKGEYVKYKYSIGQRLLLLVLLILPLLLGVYSVNCLMVGKCTVWSWVIAILMIIWAVAVTIAAFINKSFNLDNVFG